MEVIITPSKKKDQRYDVNIKTKDTHKHISFGAKDDEDFTTHQDKARTEKRKYIKTQEKRRLD